MFQLRIGTATTLALVTLAGFVAWLNAGNEEKTPAMGFRILGAADADDE